MGCNCLKSRQSHCETVYFLPEIPGNEAWPWSHPVVLKLHFNLVITKHKLKSQFKLTQLWPLTVKVSVSMWVFSLIWQAYQKYVSSALWLYNRDYCLASNVFTNILKINELAKIYNKILKKLLTIIIYQVNSISLQLASEIYWKCTRGWKKTLLALN